MGDTGDDFKALAEHKKEIRAGLEPKRFEYAMNKLRASGFSREIVEDYIQVNLNPGTVRFWPFTGWFCGQKPHGKIKGRGIHNLIKQMGDLNAITGE